MYIFTHTSAKLRSVIRFASELLNNWWHFVTRARQLDITRVVEKKIIKMMTRLRSVCIYKLNSAKDRWNLIGIDVIRQQHPFPFPPPPPPPPHTSSVSERIALRDLWFSIYSGAVKHNAHVFPSNEQLYTASLLHIYTMGMRVCDGNIVLCALGAAITIAAAARGRHWGNKNFI